LTRFNDDNNFLRDSLLIMLDVMDLVRRDYLGENNEEDQNAAALLIPKIITEINNLVYEPDDSDLN